MNAFDTLPWYIISLFQYMAEMLPCMGAALIVFVLFRPAQNRKLKAKNLVSGPWREGALLLFVMFVAGLAALTLFPAGFWRRVIHSLRLPEFRTLGLDLAALYPSWEETAQRLADWRNVLLPFQEIRRALRHGSWLMFIQLGNIMMFLPVGFLVALLYRRARWWKSMLIGFLASVFVESTQLFIGRVTDIDDVILNTTGALAGFWLFWLLRALFPRVISKFQCHERKDTQNGILG
ncbi:MAG: VanZ family protein [Lawsonibacter sp.]|nr:VanZ family protein [Lawsonibacter sp.]